MTAGTVVITGGILATVILLCIIAVLCYCRLQYYCCKKDASDEEEEEEKPDLPAHSRVSTCNACSSQVLDGQGMASLSELSNQQQQGAQSYCSTYSSPFYIRTADMVHNGGERITYTPTCYKEVGPPLQMAAFQSYPVTRPSLGREAFTNPRAISTEV
ncbi:protein FAM163A [Tachyglossus aculeatus]|uniref:protein FAM163A n=1 Tax=Tachyglossus aculeatus TaxID=9261 RepID=UPI0018F5A63C|nr:protein FAM163A [Tachyglossus aculeatus]